MAHRKLTLVEFREDFPETRNSDDTPLAQDVLRYLDESDAGAVVIAARRFLQAQADFDQALMDAGLRDTIDDLLAKV